MGSGGLQFHHEERGQGRPLLALHGYGIDHQSMLACLEPAFSHDAAWRRLYVDLPGMGHTPAPEWITTSDGMLAAVESMIDELIGDEPFALVGNSYGAYLARALVSRAPHRVIGVLFVAPCIVPRAADRDCPPHHAVSSDTALLAQLTPQQRSDFTSFAVVQSQDVWRRYERDICAAETLADESFLQMLQQTGYPLSFDVDDMAPYAGPGLFLTGRQDAFVGYRDAWAILEKYPAATFTVLDRAGHLLPLEQPALFTRAVRDWLDRLAS